MTVLKRHPVDRPSISQPFAAVSDRGSHLGIDYRPDYPGQTDFPVYAAHDGFVVSARGTAHVAGNPWEQIPGNGNNGKSVIIQAVAPHQACATSYNHLGTIAVKEGQWVTAGTFLGYMGWTGFVIGQWGWNGWQTDRNPSGTHLHFELFIDYGNGQYPEGTSYGRVNPLDYLDVVTTIPIAPGASGGTSTTKEDTLSAAEVKELKDHINAVMLGGYTWEGKKHPGIGMVVEENQRRIDRIPDRVWRETTVRRGGKDVPVLQDLADGTTYALASLDGDGLSAEDLTAIRAEMDEAVETVKGTVNVVVSAATTEPKEQP